jgi:hypothetical protein
MRSSKPQGPLFVMYNAFRAFRSSNYSVFKKYFDRHPDKRPLDFGHSAGNDRIQRAMEREDRRAFRAYRKEAMMGLKGVVPNDAVDRVYEHDPEGEGYEEDSDIEMGDLGDEEGDEEVVAHMEANK